MKRKKKRPSVPARCNGAGVPGHGCAAWSDNHQACMCITRPGVCMVTGEVVEDVRIFFPGREA